MSGKLQELQTLSGHGDRVWMAKWSPNGKLLASASGDHTVRIWAGSVDGDKSSANEFRCVAVLEGIHQRTIRAVDWSPNGKYLASCSFDGTVSVWTRSTHSEDSGEYELIATLEGHENEVKSVSWSRDGTLLATCGRDKSVWIWESESEGEFECLSVLHGHSQDVKCVLFHPTNRVLFSSSYDDSVKVWAEEDMEWSCVNTLKAHSSTVWALAFNSNGKEFASVGDDLNVYVWESAQTNEEGKELEKWVQSACISGAHKRTIYSVSWSTDGFIATGAADNCIRIFQQNYNSNKFSESPRFELCCSVENSHQGDVNFVQWNPVFPNILVSAGDDHNVKLWRFTSL